MKKFLVLTFVMLFVVTSLNFDVDFSNVTHAKSKVSKANLNKGDKIWLKGLGFQQETIENMPEEAYSHIKEQFKGKTGNVITSKTEYFKVHKYKKNGKTKAKFLKKPKKEALEAAKKIHKKKEKKSDNKLLGFISFNTADAASDGTNDGWIKQTITVSDIGSTYLAKTSYDWLSVPNITLQDAIGITHGDNVDVHSGTFFSQHYYHDYSGDNYIFDYEADEKDYFGYGDKFDLVSGTEWFGPADSNKGYMYYEFTKDKAGDNTADLFGHYAHSLTSSWFSISLSYGGFSLSGASESDATDTHVDFTY